MPIPANPAPSSSNDAGSGVTTVPGGPGDSDTGSPLQNVPLASKHTFISGLLPVNEPLAAVTVSVTSKVVGNVPTVPPAAAPLKQSKFPVPLQPLLLRPPLWVI